MDDVSANPVAGSEPDPVSLIDGILEREDNPPTEKPRGQKPDPEPEAPDEEAPEDGPEVPPEEEGDDDEDSQEGEPQEAELYTVKVDGKEQQVSRDELLAGYQRHADYSKKTAEVAEQRRAAEAFAQSIQAERQHYAQQLDQVASILQATLPPPPDQSRLQLDPIGYMQHKELYEQRVTELRGVLGERDRAQQQSQQQMQAYQERAQEQALNHARVQLLDAMPEWRKPETAKKEQRQVADYLRTIGYQEHEISSAADPRAIVMAKKAMLYDKLQEAKPQVQQRVASAPKMVRPGSTGPAPDKSKAITQQIRRSGGKDLDAVARLIELG